MHFDKRISRDRTLISSLCTVSVTPNQYLLLVVNEGITAFRGLELRPLKKQRQITERAAWELTKHLTYLVR